MKKVLIVDDVSTNRMILTDMLEDAYDTMEASNGREALQLLNENHDCIALVLLDLRMPGLNGYDVLEVMKANSWLESLPVIVITGEDSNESEEKSLKLGATDYIRKPFNEAIVRRRVDNTAELFAYKRLLESKVREQTRELNEQYDKLLEMAEQIMHNNEKIIEAMGMVVEYRDQESGDHVVRVKTYTEILAREMMNEYPEYHLTEERVQHIAVASVLHDIGKIAIPDHILLKPGKLTPEEFDYMKTHTTRGSEMLNHIDGAWDKEFGDICHDICRYHHEKYDGRGYPDGLKGDDIPLAAQIVSVADVYDALVTERVYKAAYTPEKAFDMIISGECGMFSPALMRCFTNVRSKIEAAFLKDEATA